MIDERDPFDPIFDTLATHDDAPPPDPRFVRELRGQLMKQAAQTMPAPAGAVTAGASIPLARPERRLDRRAVLQIAAIVALLLAWVGTIAGGGPREIRDSLGAFIQTGDDRGEPSMFRGNNARTGVVNAAGPAVNPLVAWRSQPAEPGFAVTNVNSNTILLAYETAGRLVALERDSGAERWSFDTGCMFLGTSPLMVDGLIYVSSSCPAQARGILIVIGEQDGVERWRVEVPGAEVQTSPMIADGAIYLLTSGVPQGVRALDASDGRELWTAQIERMDKSSSAPESAVYIGNVASFSPAYGDGRLFVTAFDGAVYALDGENGEILWSFDTGGNAISTPAYHDGRLYLSHAGITVPDVEGGFVALDAGTGEVIWQADLPDHSPYGGPVIVDGLAVASLYNAPSRSTVAYHLDSGEIAWRIELAGTVIAADGVLYMLNLNSGETLAIDPVTGAVIWRAFTANFEIPPSEAVYIRDEPLIDGGELIIGSQARIVLAIASDPGSADPIPSPGADAALDFTGLGPCTPPVSVEWWTLEGEPALSLVPVNQNQREGLPAAIHPDELPEGTPVAPEIEAAIRATLDEVGACLLRRGETDTSGFFSEDFFRREWVRVRNSASGTRVYSDAYIFFALVDARLVNVRELPDGRIGVELPTSEIFSYFVIFVPAGDRWLIDEIVQVTLHPEGKG